ncbi:MAG: ATP-binding protein [Cuspidothrix sp.]
MLVFPDLGFSKTLPLSLFNQLGELLQEMAQAAERDAFILTQAALAKVKTPLKWQRQRFKLILSPGFNALLVGNLQPTEAGKNDRVNTSLTFHPDAIALFISQLGELLKCDTHTCQILDQYRREIAANDPTLQSQFTLLLLEYFLPHSLGSINIESTAICQDVEDSLKKQIAQEQLLNRVTTQIRKSLDLSVTMNKILAQVREFLDLDRLVIYKFEYTKSKAESILINSQVNIDTNYVPRGCVIYEVSAKKDIPSVLDYQEENCFQPHTQCWQKYRQSFTLAVNDIEETYLLENCLLNFLREVKVRAKLAVPIIFDNKLWGLLIAHQCYIPREWHENEKKLLTAIAEELAIAIKQTELMQSLTQEKQTLEQRVIERTIALREALIAAEAASRIKSEFLATISHELLTPLTYVIGMSSTLLSWPLGELSTRQRNYLQTIHDSGEHLLSMINDILDLSQIEAGKTVLHISDFSLIKTGQNILESLKEKANSQKLTLQLDLQINPTQDNFTADVHRVEQILWNLLTNAIKFTPEDGTVTLRIWIEDNTAILQIEDTGIGIPEEKLPLLFEKFQQLDTPYRRRYEGTGLGLALTKQLVELHRGRIEVESTMGIGSIFTVWIPKQLKVIKVKND